MIANVQNDEDKTSVCILVVIASDPPDLEFSYGFRRSKPYATNDVRC